MTMAIRIAIGLMAALFILIGLNFLANPVDAAKGFFVVADGSQGLATIRADFPGFFIGSAVFALLGAVRGQAAPLYVPMLMLAIALTGRFVSLGADGVGPMAIPPMVVEALGIALMVVGTRVLKRG
ncbi:hypothetical protein IP88_01505 [alpha proteobacterium AAP81b]|nr:hypothetical protein IP88_01505 [alpha proteobacterium AAP81b]